MHFWVFDDSLSLSLSHSITHNGLVNSAWLCSLSTHPNSNQVHYYHFLSLSVLKKFLFLVFLPFVHVFVFFCSCLCAFVCVCVFACEDVIWFSAMEARLRNWLLGYLNPSFHTLNLLKIRFPKVGTPSNFAHPTTVLLGSPKLLLRGNNQLLSFSIFFIFF